MTSGTGFRGDDEEEEVAVVGECLSVDGAGKNVRGKPLNVACFLSGEMEKLFVDLRPW